MVMSGKTIGIMSGVVFVAAIMGNSILSTNEDNNLSASKAVTAVSPAKPVEAVKSPPQIIALPPSKTVAVTLKSAGAIKIADLDEGERLIRLIINANGYLCAKPIEVRPTGSEGLYGVQCITHRSGEGTANYLVNARTKEVTEI